MSQAPQTCPSLQRGLSPHVMPTGYDPHSHKGTLRISVGVTWCHLPSSRGLKQSSISHTHRLASHTRCTFQEDITIVPLSLGPASPG